MTTRPCSRLHDRALLDYLAGAWERWEAAGLDADPGQDRVVPYLFPHPGPARRPRARARRPSITARAGQFAYDTMTLIGPGTWEAARAAVDAALTAADLVLGGEPAAYACCRPPGHHATRDALRRLLLPQQRRRSPPPACATAIGGPVAVIDIDAHHGNGTQSIFYDDPEVLVGSVARRPRRRLVPALPRLRRRRPVAAPARARTATCRSPRARATRPWLEAVAELAGWAARGGAGALVVALGVDAAAGDPESPLDGHAPTGYEAAGRTLGALGLPTVVVQEGGYDLETIGAARRARRSPASSPGS